MPLALFTPFRLPWLLHSDDHLLVVNKPVGVSTHAADPARLDDLVARLQSWRAALDGVSPSEIYLGVHQRLDRDTSGVIAFARSAIANKSLARAFENRTVSKRYFALAVANKNPPRTQTLTHDLVAQPDGTTLAVSPGRGGKNSRRAVTKLKVIKQIDNRVLLELTPETGRTHQLRVQCATIGLPLVGDTLYGGLAAPRLMLHAESLTLDHPLSQTPQTYRAPLPALFNAWLQGLPDPRDLTTLLETAADRRWYLARDEKITAFRLAHDGDLIAHHTVDVYNHHAVVSVLGDSLDPALADALASAGFEGVYVKHRPKQSNTLVDTRRETLAPTLPVRGTPTTSPLVITENSLRFLVRLDDGLSTGIFLDQRENRKRVRALSKGKTVLNLFAYTGAFTVAAAAGGALRTVTVDASRTALETARQNLSLNGLDDPRHGFVTNDVFAWLRGAIARRDRFEFIIADPPSYSNLHGSRWASESDWKRLAKELFTLVSPGGALLACSNHKGILRMRFRRHLHEAARMAGREVTQMKDLAPPEDFPPCPGAEPHLKSVLVTLR